MSKKKPLRSARYGTDEVDIYISQQAKPRYVIYNTGERSSFYTKLDELREYVRKHVNSLQPLNEWKNDVLTEIEPVPSGILTDAEKPAKTRAYKAIPKPAIPRQPKQTVTIVVDGTSIVVPVGSKVEFL